MTALTIATDIPTDINSVEKLAMWAALALSTINPSNRVLVNSNDSARQAEFTIFPGGDNEIYFSARIILKLAATYATDDTIRLWENARDVSNTALPAGFKTNG